MNFLNTIAGSGFALVLTFTGPIAWGQSLSNKADAGGASGNHHAGWSRTKLCPRWIKIKMERCRCPRRNSDFP